MFVVLEGGGGDRIEGDRRGQGGRALLEVRGRTCRRGHIVSEMRREI